MLYRGCEVKKMDQFSVGLSDDELQRRIDENPNEPWRPDFIAAIGHKRNDYWVKKIIDQVCDGDFWSEGAGTARGRPNREVILDERMYL